jgi:hypothetical protein
LCGAVLRRAASDGPVRDSMDTAFTGPCCSKLGNAYQRLLATEKVYTTFFLPISPRELCGRRGLVGKSRCPF